MIISEMKPMVYGGDSEVLYYEVFDDGYGILIENIHGSHPCGYIKLPKELKNKIIVDVGDEEVENMLWVDAPVHGGFTFFGKRHVQDFYEWFIGWDYAHLDDYCGYEGSIHRPGNEKKWTTEEILEEAKVILKALREGKYGI